LHTYEVMKAWAKRTQGSCIESKGSALVWQYRDCDQYFGAWQAKELSLHLQELLFGYDVDVIEGKGYVEVKLRNTNKGILVQKVYQKVTRSFGEVEFVLCIGDDQSDEAMFEMINLFTDTFEKSSGGGDGSQQSTTDGGSDDVAESSGMKRTNSFHAATSSSMPLRRARTEDVPTGLPTKTKSFGGLGGLGSCGSFAGLGMMGGSSVNLHTLGDCPEDDVNFNKRYFTCTVGSKPTAARYFVHDTDEVSELLHALAQINKRRSTVREHGSLGTFGGAASAHTLSGATGAELAAELRRYLDTQPVGAPSSTRRTAETF